ncbi:MAG TPA: STAS domain-containing protein [Candidatus Elarobacter sp.]
MAPNYYLLRLDGYLDIGRYPEIRRAFEDAPAGVPVLVDLQDATGVDSVFLSELLLFRRRQRPQAVTVVIPPKGQLAKIFEIANLGEKLDVYLDLSSAVAALGIADRPAEGTSEGRAFDPVAETQDERAPG